MHLSFESSSMKKSEFERIVTKTFRGLESRHGFKRGETVYSRNGCTVQYLNATTDVTLHYDIGREPWLTIADVKDVENKSTLGWLLVERGIEKTPMPADAFRSTTVSEKDLASVLEKKNQQLLEYGKELMIGDFSLMPNLQKRAKKYAQECERYIAIHKTK
jgi:hypothetical protein